MPRSFPGMIFKRSAGVSFPHCPGPKSQSLSYPLSEGPGPWGQRQRSNTEPPATWTCEREGRGPDFWKSWGGGRAAAPWGGQGRGRVPGAFEGVPWAVEGRPALD